MIKKLGDKNFVEKMSQIKLCPVMWNPNVEEYCRIQYHSNGNWSFIEPLQFVDMQDNDDY